MSLASLSVTALVIFLTISVNSEIVRISTGEIEGTTIQTRHGDTFHAFLGIPYAEPPIGNLRFRAPVPKGYWPGVLNCTAYGPRCMQNMMMGTVFMSEDCLQVNVFTKNLPRNESSGPVPVIMFIHGGAFQSGSGVNHGPDYLLERDIVLVTINYRLGSFGFMALENEDVPGNAGLKDQNLALRWIQRNIASFGGNPHMVTVAGTSAGAHGATAHMISPMSRGLFRNMIATSGGIAWQKKLLTNSFEATHRLASILNCSTDDTAAMLVCLRNASAEAITRNHVPPSNGCPIMTWIPVVEKDFGHERFLIEDPNDSFREGRYENISLMTGITTDEFISPVASILGNEERTRNMNENFEEFAPMCFFFEGNEFRSAAEIARALRKFYLPLKVIDGRSFNSLNQLLADGVIGNGVHRLVHYVTDYIPVYYFQFAFSGPNSIFRFPRNSPYGIHHGDEMQYIFRSQMMPFINLDDPENVVVQRMTRMWENFAWTGNPNNASDPYLSNMIWPQHDLINEHYLEIGSNLVEKRGLFLNRFTVWDQLELAPSEK